MRDFMQRVFSKSGISPTGSYLPPAIHPSFTSNPEVSIPNAMLEAEMVMTGALSDVFARTANCRSSFWSVTDDAGLGPQDIDILVTCASIFCPTPSLASMLVHKFKMREDIQSYSLGGMGCGTGVVGINLCRDLLKARPNSVCVYVPAEITSACYYPGHEKNRMVANCIFRMGGAAIMLTNKASLRSRAKYELVAASRIHLGADDEAYGCMSWGPDSIGINGVHLGKEVVTSAGATVTAAVTAIAPYILSWSEFGRAAFYAAQRKYAVQKGSCCRGNASKQNLSLVLSCRLLGGGPEFKPEWTRCCEHFALHAGGYAVLKGLQKGLDLPSEKMIPSYACLRDYGNTSCSTTWYSMAYIESQMGVKKGERVLQLGVGGGTKAGVNCWKALRDLRVDHKVWQHLERPLKEADLPRGLEGSGKVRDPLMAEWGDNTKGATDGVPTHAA
ncbi:FAE1/Type III polyketide synthase-like protein-domain-containing protein [Dunaliella salina]|uniref:3-ketoacyl-CoA synthase n=1 Tax=Dunaliella salina TaxID=3046 RepID=A0ABQ7G712_DUNSA|nr:FAE1/Type III polyketide synthase-like protein-domain-containing protein [Dunaliella salina]|eukprot:KAF5830397.1 FAE1/Type III polyketide synthase-like protein-domain-containing protein [Dunaliella salina]